MFEIAGLHAGTNARDPIRNVVGSKAKATRHLTLKKDGAAHLIILGSAKWSCKLTSVRCAVVKTGGHTETGIRLT